MNKRLTCLILFLASALSTAGAGVPTVKMEARRLPDLNIPRMGHALLYINGELTVIGGHTTGFIPTATAEFFKDGKWTVIPSLYTHDNGFCLTLRDGNVLLGGGLSEAFGVGQSFSVERYLPAEHSFEPIPILDRRRAASSALEMEDGTILVSGNWYASDALELYSATEGFVTVKQTAENRSYPWILPTAPDNAIIFSAVDSWGKRGQGRVDRLHGEPFEETLLRSSALPMCSDANAQRNPCKIGDYDYLLLTHNDSLEFNGIMRIHKEDFSMLELQVQIPLEGVNGPIRYYHPLLGHGENAWAFGTDTDGRAYLLQIGYKPALKGGKATLRLHYTDPLEDLPMYGACTMLPDGRIALAGGIDGSNYKPYASAYIFDPNEATLVADSRARARSAGMVAGILAGLALAGLGWWLAHRRKKAHGGLSVPDQAELPEPQIQRDRDLFERVSALMEDGLYTQKGLTIADLATALGTNTKYISSCINAGAGCSFLDYMNGYRIRFAQKKLLEEPQMRISDIADAAGFASESAFYRNFKTVTGFTPAEWLKQQ